MQRAKAFFLISAGCLLLAIAYQLGASTATAQAPANPVVASENGWVYTAHGDVHLRVSETAHIYRGNVFNSSPISTEKGSIGSLKIRYR